MTGVTRKAAILVALGLVAATAAMAGIPSPANCDLPASGFVDLVSCDGSGALPNVAAYKATITVRDVGNFPVVGSVVSLTFCSDFNIYDAIPGGTVVGQRFTSTAVTDINGQVTVEVSGGGNNADGSTYGANGLDCVTWRADGYVLGTSSVTAFDEDGDITAPKQGVGGSDLTSWLSDYLLVPAVYKERSDFSHANELDGGDLTVWLTYYLTVPDYNSSCGTL